ncbi:hypothetical protein An12g08290 [Aspergillus niger]|uniref:Uncharacterized protein n=2 Tax=Aspergillus niger TaxID=5061 RepID=A2R0E1_ASPNC|nr:hypothetical protein An12g08290 [Aspergillus niger]CAK41279.1 hypothetical protein An12g08290 [Aspergillus niger]
MAVRLNCRRGYLQDPRSYTMHIDQEEAATCHENTTLQLSGQLPGDQICARLGPSCFRARYNVEPAMKRCSPTHHDEELPLMAVSLSIYF